MILRRPSRWLAAFGPRALPLALAVWVVMPTVAATVRPNILFLLTDDQRFDTIHALGNDTCASMHAPQPTAITR